MGILSADQAKERKSSSHIHCPEALVCCAKWQINLVNRNVLALSISASCWLGAGSFAPFSGMVYPAML